MKKMRELSFVCLLVVMADARIISSIKEMNSDRVLVRAPVELGDILLDYDRSLRPFFGHAAVNVTFSMGVAGAEWRKGRLRIDAFLRARWTDPRLVFNAQPHETLVLRGADQTRIWLPDTLVLGTADDVLLNGGVVTVAPSGAVLFSQLRRFVVPCPAAAAAPERCNASLSLQPYLGGRDELRLSWAVPGAAADLQAPGTSPIRNLTTSAAPPHLAQQLLLTVTANTPLPPGIVHFLLQRETGEL